VPFPLGEQSLVAGLLGEGRRILQRFQLVPTKRPEVLDLRLDEYPPLRLYWLSSKTYTAGIEQHSLGQCAERSCQDQSE